MYLVVGLRQGAMVHVPGNAELAVNGKIDADSAARLQSAGARVMPYVWREPVLSAQDQAELAAAQASLEASRRQLDRDIAKGLDNLWGSRASVKRNALERMRRDAPRD